jgi:hypothetical protein
MQARRVAEMLDLLFVALTVAFFAASVALASALGRLGGEPRR